MKRTLALCLLAAAASQPVLAETPRSVRAAGLADATMALYFEAQYTGPKAGSSANLQVEHATVILVTQADGDAPAKRIEMTCKDSAAMLAPFQQSPYGRGTEGAALAFECAPQGTFLFVLLREIKSDLQTDRGNSCGKAGMLNTKPLALAASFGHQAFCLEDWSAVKDPGARLEREFAKRKGRK